MPVIVMIIIALIICAVTACFGMYSECEIKHSYGNNTKFPLHWSIKKLLKFLDPPSKTLYQKNYSFRYRSLKDEWFDDIDE